MTPSSSGPRPVKVKRYDADLGCDVRHVVGYVGKCDVCGEQTRTCSTIRIARLALDMHRIWEHGW